MLVDREDFCERVLLCASLELAELAWVPALRFLGACCVGAAELAADEDSAAAPARLGCCCCSLMEEGADFAVSVVGRGLRVDDGPERGGASLGALDAIGCRTDFLGSPSSFLSGYVSKSIVSRSLSSA